MSSSSTLIWLTPTLFALFAWGIGQGLVKKYINDVSPARFCLFFVAAKSLVNLGYFIWQSPPNPFASAGLEFLLVGTFAYVLDGCAWILYFLSIVAGPITIVGTLSAAFPALTVLLAWIFLGEQLNVVQYAGVGAVIAGCIGLSYDPNASNQSKKIHSHWVLYAAGALLLWGSAQVIVKYAYSLPAANDANLALFNTFGGFLSLGIYGLLYGRRQTRKIKGEWLRSFLPMGLMAAGDLFVIIALGAGPSAIVTPVSGAYPLVTLVFAYLVLREKITRFQWLCVTGIILGLMITPPDSMTMVAGLMSTIKQRF